MVILPYNNTDLNLNNKYINNISKILLRIKIQTILYQFNFNKNVKIITIIFDNYNNKIRIEKLINKKIKLPKNYKIIFRYLKNVEFKNKSIIFQSDYYYNLSIVYKMILNNNVKKNYIKNFLYSIYFILKNDFQIITKKIKNIINDKEFNYIRNRIHNDLNINLPLINNINKITLYLYNEFENILKSFLEYPKKNINNFSKFKYNNFYYDIINIYLNKSINISTCYHTLISKLPHLRNNKIIFIEENSDINIKDIYNKFCINQNFLLKIIYAKNINNIFFIFNNTLFNIDYKYIIKLFLSDKCVNCIKNLFLNKNIKKNIFCNFKKIQSNKINYYNFILLLVTLTYKIRNLLMINNIILNNFDYIEYNINKSKLLIIENKCQEKNISLSSYFYSVIILSIIKIYPMSLINIINYNIIIPYLFIESIDNFWTYANKLDYYFKNKLDENIIHIFEKYNIYKYLNKNLFKNYLFDIEYLDFNNINCENSKIKIDKILYCSNNKTICNNASFKIYLFKGTIDINITHKYSTKESKLLFNFVKYILDKSLYI